VGKSYSKHQQKIIKNYYEKRDAIALQRAQELVTELYLSDGKKRTRCWEQLAGHLAKLGVKQSQIDHLVAKDNPELVAKTVQKLLEKAG
jgi:acetylornithine deacetylase/succinyl-diaminopimelate desuccinylase-like protein